MLFRSFSADDKHTITRSPGVSLPEEQMTLKIGYEPIKGDPEAVSYTHLMIEYIKLFWEGAPEGELSVILYEVDTGNGRLLSAPLTSLQMAAPAISLTFTTELLKSRPSPPWRN